jgi:hypothetical protein
MQGNRSLTLLTVPVADREQSVQIRIRGEWLSVRIVKSA